MSFFIISHWELTATTFTITKTQSRLSEWVKDGLVVEHSLKAQSND